MRIAVVPLALLLATVSVPAIAADDFVPALVKVATGKEAPHVRAQAIDELGQFGAKGLGSNANINIAVASLGKIAADSDPSDSAKKYLCLHAVTALGLMDPRCAERCRTSQEPPGMT